DYSLHIDCGGLLNSTDSFHTSWISDRYYSGGAVSVVSEPLRFVHQEEKTLRYFPITSGKRNCYSIPAVADGARYFLRTFTVYDNYDGRSHSPSFDVSVEGTLVFSWRSPWPDLASRSGAYSDLFFYQDGPIVDVCFYSIATDAPVIGSLELTQIDPTAYPFDLGTNSSNHILVNYGRLSSWPDEWGPGFTNDTDFFGRTWQPESMFRGPSAATGVNIRSISSAKPVADSETSPNYFPAKLYQTATTTSPGSGSGVLEYYLNVDAKLDYLLFFHFAEIDPAVTQAGQRVFDIYVNGENLTRIDVYKEVGGYRAFDRSYVVKSLSSTMIVVRLDSVIGSPIICGLENYAIIPPDIRTAPDQVSAMQALKASLRIPDRMGWNGDPCAPPNWVAWEGVTCFPRKDGSSLVISEIDVGSQGLKGYITDQIGLLTDLVSLNLSSNSLEGEIPNQLSQKSLVKLDLSNNRLTGYIPDGLTSSSLQTVYLDNNLLQGRVPEELYSIGVHGGAIDLSGNKGLCGVPSLPRCPLFWGKHGLSTGGKVAIALSVVIAFGLLVGGIAYYVMRRRRNDYDFGLPHELLVLAAKRNKYHRHKSLRDLEMESQHAR
ncbi:hypothetical protein M569_07106, partial [Genlisea aurea]